LSPIELGHLMAEVKILQISEETTCDTSLRSHKEGILVLT